MKRDLFFSVIFAMSAFCVHAQDSDYRPFIEEGKVWVSLHQIIFRDQSICYDSIAGDTLVNSRMCKRWYQHYTFRNSDVVYDYTIPVYEEDKKVYFFLKNESTPRLAYDFGAKDGDGVFVSVPSGSIMNICSQHGADGPLMYTINFTDTIYIQKHRQEFVGGRLQKVMDIFGVRTWSNPGMHRWVESIGSCYGPSWNLCQQENFPGTYLIYCVLGDEVLYANKDLAEFYHIPLPTSVTSPSDKSVNCKSVNSNFLDLSGRRLPTLPTRKGIYIKDGRKVLIK